MGEVEEGFKMALEALQMCGAAVLVTFQGKTADGVMTQRPAEGEFRVRASQAEGYTLTVLNGCFGGVMPKADETVSIGGQEHRVLEVRKVPGSPFAELLLAEGFEPEG